MSSAPTAREIAADASWLAQALDPGKGLVRLVRIDAETYRAASFLDDRMFAQKHESHVMPWAGVEAAVPGDARTDARWIFHIGHVGSTLIARLLGEIETVLAIREPRSLRDLAAFPAEQRRDFVPGLRKLMSRTFAPDQAALIKATSFVSEIAPELVPEAERALFLFASPRNYVASILAGENSVKEMAALAPLRAQRVAARATLPAPCTGADAAAAAWACEMTALEAAAEKMVDGKVEWADFDQMLGDMAGELGRVARFFGFASDRIPEIAAGPLMGRYSKAVEYDYSPALRRELIDEAATANRADIDSAIAMLQSAGENSLLLARALRRTECTESSSS